MNRVYFESCLRVELKGNKMNEMGKLYVEEAEGNWEWDGWISDG